MVNIDACFDEIQSLLDLGLSKIAACRKVKDKYDLAAMPDSIRRSFDNYNSTMELKKQVLNSQGEVTSESYGRPQINDDIDKSKYEPVSFTTNPFGEGKWIRYDKITGYSPEELKEELDNRKPINYKIKKLPKRTNTGVFMVADFHLGAYVGDLLKSPDFNYNVVSRMLQECAETINSHKYKEVHLFCNGDFIESFSGLNHVNSWKGLSKGAYGMKAVILAHEILSEHFFSKIENLKYVGFVSGNHDRVSSNKDEDQEGQVAEMMEYLFRKDFKGVESEHSPLLLAKKIDGIGYVVTHGHLAISQKEISKVLFDYGFQGIYNVYAKAHKHTRETKKTMRYKNVKYADINVVELDSADYRAVTIPPLFTGNFYSESLGFTSTAGMSHFYNNGRGKVIYIDYTL